MLCYVMLYHVISYYIILYYTILYYIILYYISSKDAASGLRLWPSVPRQSAAQRLPLDATADGVWLACGGISEERA